MGNVLKKVIKDILAGQGYQVKQTTSVEKKYLRGLQTEWISKNPQLFAQVYLQNRRTLSLISNWISTETLDSSIWRYGVPLGWESKFDDHLERCGLNDIQMEVTSSDLMALLGDYLDHIKYLEIGVSVGKNFLQLCNVFKNAEMSAIDVEDISPVLESCFEAGTTVWESEENFEIETLRQTKIEKKFSIRNYVFGDNNNEIHYIVGDQFSSKTWDILKGKKFNFIFSDGSHSVEAITSELDNLINLELVDRRNLIVLWDDLFDLKMQNAFVKNANKLCNIFGCGDDHISMYHLFGTYGYKRNMGLFVFLEPS